jgi:hypothetical protein
MSATKICFLTITQSILKNFMFSLLILVNGHIPHNSWKKSFLSDSKWRLKFKMVTNFQSAVTFVLMKFFSKFPLHFAYVENEKKLWKKFFHFGSRSRWCHLPKELVKNSFSAITSEVSKFFSICFLHLFCVISTPIYWEIFF